MSTSSVRADLSRNADAFVMSTKRPFSVRGMRLPTPSALPTNVGSFTQRFNGTVCTDGGSSYVGVMVWPSFLVSSASNGPIWNATTVAGGAVTWTPSAFSNMTALVANFQSIRPVSCGLRFLNVAPNLFRGGVAYISTTQQDPPISLTNVTVINNSEETVELDLANTPRFGEEFVWPPISYAPSFQSADVAGINEPNLYTFVAPNADASANDNKLFIWMNLAGEPQAANMTYEMVVNWEAYPYPTTHNLFDTHSVLGSSDDISVALEKAGDQGKSTNTSSSLFDAAADIGGAMLDAGLAKGGGFKGALRAVLPQIPSLVKRAGGFLSSMFSAQDYENHLMAVVHGVSHVSPTLKKEHLGLTKAQFLQVLDAEGVTITYAEEKSAPSSSPSPAWAVVPSGLISNQPPEVLSAIPKGNAAAPVVDPRQPVAADGPGKARLRSLLFA